MNRLHSHSIAWLFAPMILASFVLAARGHTPSDDEQTLRSAGLSTDGASLLAAVRKHTLSAETRKKIDNLIVRLGDDSFVARENATKELFALGRVTLPQLQRASKHEDLEIARRAKRLIERVEREPAHHLPVAVLRLLAVRKPVGAVEALLAYLPYAEDEDVAEEVQTSLAALARRDGKAEPALRRALEDPQKTPAVRMRIALALAIAGERETVPVLIDLLAVLPVEQVSRVEDALYQLAGDSAPKTPEGTEPAERKKYRDAWAAWWKANANHADLNRLRAPSLLGYTLICDYSGNRVYEIDRHRKQRWVINNLQGPSDAWVLPGNRVLIAEVKGKKITERDFKGQILWSQEGLPGQVVNAQRLPNGNTLIALYCGSLIEVNRAGKTVYTIDTLPGLLAARRSRQGAIYVIQGNQCVVLKTTGKLLKRFSFKLPLNDGGCLDLLPDGHILVFSSIVNKVMEFDSEGNTLWEMKLPEVTKATALPNGHILVASRNAHRLYELDRAGKVVWEYKDAGDAYQVRRR